MFDNLNAVWSEFPRSFLLLSSATKLHAAAIDEKAGKKDLSALVEDFYRNLCSKLLPAVDCRHGLDPAAEKARKDLHVELVFQAGGAEQSAITRSYRYAISLKDVVWPPGKGGICFGSDGNLPKADLERALRTLSSKRTKAILRELPIPDAEAEKDAMEFEIARAIRSLRGSPDRLSSGSQGQRQPRGQYNSKWAKPRQRAVVLRQQGLSYKEIAKQLKREFAYKGSEYTKLLTSGKVENFVTYESRKRKQQNSRSA